MTVTELSAVGTGDLYQYRPALSTAEVRIVRGGRALYRKQYRPAPSTAEVRIVRGGRALYRKQYGPVPSTANAPGSCAGAAPCTEPDSAKRHFARVFDSPYRRSKIVPETEHSQVNGTTATEYEHYVVAVFNAHTDAEEAVKSLQKADFDMTRLSIIGKVYHADENVVGYYNTGDRMGYWGKLGAFWGGFWGLLSGSAFFVVPGIGPIVVGGPIVALILGTLQGAGMVGGISAIGAALYSIGIPRDSIIKYEMSLKSNEFLVIVHGTTGDIAEVCDILQSANPVETNVHRAGEQ